MCCSKVVCSKRRTLDSDSAGYNGMGCEALVCNCQYVLRIHCVIAKSNVMVIL
jgi:hypothetical protein